MSVHYDHQLLSLTTETLNTEQKENTMRRNPRFNFTLILQIIHFLIVMFYLWAGVVEFINNPPFFDAYGDALDENKLPEGLFQNDPRYQQSVHLRFMDIPLLAIIIGYAVIAVWLKFKGLSWLITLSISIAFLFFWIVNFWGAKYFDWRYFSSRMTGLELQVSALALTGTSVLMVLFYSRKKLPFKFKSSLKVRKFGCVHVFFNFAAIYLISFTSMLLWFSKLYISWSCFKNQRELLQLCQITNQVECYPCNNCTTEGIRQCYKRQESGVFSCNAQMPSESKNEGAFCIFNYNMSYVQYLMTFAYIGGLCVFLSTVSRILGHYIVRVIFLIVDCLKTLITSKSPPDNRYRANNNIEEVNENARTSVITLQEELQSPINDYYDSPDSGRRSERAPSPVFDEPDTNFFDASCG